MFAEPLAKRFFGGPLPRRPNPEKSDPPDPSRGLRAGGQRSGQEGTRRCHQEGPTRHLVRGVSGQAGRLHGESYRSRRAGSGPAHRGPEVSDLEALSRGLLCARKSPAES